MNEEGAHDLIRGSELQISGRLVDASNATLLAHIEVAGGKTKVIYKPIAGERPLWDFADGNLASREVAAYLVSEAIGFELVPFTTLRDGPFGLGSVQQWIETDENADVVEIAQSENPQIRQMALFDAIVNNTDRKFGHILITEEGKIFGCDHGVTFHEEDKLRTVLWQFAGEEFDSQERALLTNFLITAEQEAFVDQICKLLNPEEILALKRRIARLLEMGTFPEPSEEWPPVPWPPF